MWDLLDQGSNPHFLHWQAKIFTSEPPGKPQEGFFFLKLFIYLNKFLAPLGLGCFAQAFSGCGEWKLFSSCGARASRCGGFSCCIAWAVGTQDLVSPRGL